MVVGRESKLVCLTEMEQRFDRRTGKTNFVESLLYTANWSSLNFFLYLCKSELLQMNIRKLIDISELPYETVVTVGMFDGVHIGHRHILDMLERQAAERGLHPVVVTFDCHPRQVLKADRAASFRVNTNEERYRLLEECGVQEVVEVHFTAETAQLSACEFFEQVLCQKLRCKALVLGYDNMFGNRARNDFDRLPTLAQSRGVALVVDTPVRFGGVEVSSTKVRGALQEGDVRRAAYMLGYNYCLWGTVVKGRQVGRTLGFPTANVCLDDRTKVVPAPGVYAVRVRMPDDKSLKIGMANFGTQPTFGLENTVFEVNIFDFDGDLYGKVLTVEFVDRIRDVCKFEGVERLVRQLNDDRTTARLMLQTQK